MSAAVRLLLLSREGCCLCDELEEELVEHFGPAAFAIERCEVDSREDWRERFGRSIPVLLTPEGTVLSESQLDVERVAAVLGPR